MLKGVYQIDFSGNIINKFISLKNAADFVNGCPESISGVCKGKNLSAYNYYWCFIENIEKYEHKEYKNSTKNILQYDDKGNFIKKI